MNYQIHDRGKRLQFGSSGAAPAFRHPYGKYNSRISNESFYLSSDHKLGRGSDGPEPACRRSRKSGQDARENGAKGLNERNALICQTFLTENPFFNAYYPAIRPRSADGISNRGSERSRSLSTDFDDSKTYKIIYTGDSVANNLPGNKLKKSDDIHHFHEHHHFFHDKNEEKSNSAYYDKYQYATAKEQTKSTIADPNKSFLKQPIEESCMIYDIQEGSTQRSDGLEPRKEKSQEGARHLSGSSSKSGKKSSDNETYTVVCEHCQKLLTDYPNARIIGHENLPKRFSIESRDGRTYAPHGYEPVQKANWKPANIFVAERQYQVHRTTLSQNSSRQRKSDKSDVQPMEKSGRSGRSGRRLSQFKSGDRGAENRNRVKQKLPSMIDSDHRSIIFKCDHCKSIIENYPGTRKRFSSSSSSSSNDGGFDEKTEDRKIIQKGTLLAKFPAKGPAATKRFGVVSERKSSDYKGLKGPRTSDKEKSSDLIVSGKLSNQKLSKAHSVMEKKKSPAQRASRSPRVMGRRRSSSYNAFRDTGSGAEKQKPGYKERRASSEMSKRGGSSRKGSRDSCAQDKRINSGVKESRDANESKTKSLSYKECSMGTRVMSSKKPPKESALLVKGVNHKKSITNDKKTSSTYKESTDLCTLNTRPSSSRKESKDSAVNKVAKTESKAKKSRPIKTEDRSMQTSSRKLINAQESAVAKRSSTASKTANRNTNTEESRRSETAPGGLVSSGSNNPYVKRSAARGSATLTRRTAASKDAPVIQVESTPETKQDSRVTGIQTEITDLKSQLDRLEAMHSMKIEAPDSSGNGAHEAIDCPTHPIVVCTSTTYIMTKCSNDCGDRKSTTATPKESEKIQTKQSAAPSAQCNPAEDAPAPKCKRFCCTERAIAAPAEKANKAKCNHGSYCPPSKAGQTRPNCQLVGARITRAVNRVCRCPSRDLLSRYYVSPVRTRSCDRGDISRRLFGNGKYQACATALTSGGGGLLTSHCNGCERRSDRCCRCPANSNDAMPDIKESLHRSYSDTECGSERLIAYRSYSKIVHDYELDIEKHDRTTEEEILKPQAAVEDDVEIDESSRAGYFLRTSISDVCEYRNGSLIRLMGKSGWVVYTKKLFLEGKDKECSGSVEEFPKKLDEFVIFPTSTARSNSKSNKILKGNAQESDESQEGKFLLINDRQVLSDSSIYLPLALKMLNERSSHAKNDNSTSSVHLSSNWRVRNRGIFKIRGNPIEKSNNFRNELHLLGCKSAADGTVTCKDASGGYDQRCTCRRRRQTGREAGVKKQKKEKIPVLFEEIKSPRCETKEGRMSDISLKYVYAERSRGSQMAQKVTWSTDRNGSRTKKPCLFGVSRCNKNRRNREHFSMNDKQRKHRWHRWTSQKSKGSDCYKYNKPQGDSPHNSCAYGNCSPNHACSAACERGEGELTGIRKLLKDIGISGLTFGLSRKTTCCRPGIVKPQNAEEVHNERPDESYSEDIKEEETGETEATEEVKEEISTEYETGSSVTDFKKPNPEDKRCDCVKQLEQLLTQAEFFKQPPPEPISLKQESWGGMWNVVSRKSAAVSAKKEPSINPEVRDDISLQRRRIAECENLLRQFEMQLEDVKRQREANVCKCEETPRQDGPQPGPEAPVQVAESRPAQCDDVESGVLKDPKCQIPKDDGYIRFEGKILSQLTAKKSTKSIGCGGCNEECKKLPTAVQSPPKTSRVKNAAQITSDILLRPKDSEESEYFIKSVNLDTEEVDAKGKKKSEDCNHVCCMMPPKIEISCERTMCACEKCYNIHYVDKHYLPTNCFMNCPGRDSKNKEVFTNTSAKSVSLQRREETTWVNDVFKSQKSEPTPTKYKQRREEAPLWKPSMKDEGTSTIRGLSESKATSVKSRSAKDEATSTTFSVKKNEATSTISWPWKDEAAALQSSREDFTPRVSHKETSSAIVESVPLKSSYIGMTDEATSVHIPKSDEALQTDGSGLKRESEGVSEKERFVNQSDLDKSPAEGDKGGESSSKDLSHKSSVKSRTSDVIYECSKTSATDNCEGHTNCYCGSKNISSSERWNSNRLCDCGSKLKLIEDRLRALEERKKLSSSSVSSAKKRKETAEDSSISSVKESDTSPEISLKNEIPQKKTSEELSVSSKREIQPLAEASGTNEEDKDSCREEPEKARIETTESSSLTEKSSSLENIESETDAEIKTKVITCNNMNFFDGGDPDGKTKCQCMEDNFCPFRYYQGQQDLTATKNIFFLTDIDLLRQWCGVYGCAEYSYCKNFWNVNESALKPVKLPRDWRNVKTAVASFFRSCKLRKKKFTFRRRNKSGGGSSASGASSRTNISSGSKDSFLDDCSRSSMPLKRRTFHVLAKSPRPVRPVKGRGKVGSDKRRRKRSRKRKKIHS